MPQKGKRKRALGDLTPGTMMKDVAGITGEDLQNLAIGGYKVRSRSTISDFAEITKSYDDVEKRLTGMGLDGGTTLTKIRSLWDNMPHGSFGDTQVKRQTILDSRTEGKLAAMEGDALIAPKETKGGGGGKELFNTDLPDVQALHRQPDPDKALPLGDIVGGPEFSVVPDQTLNISPDDRGINAPSEVMPGTPAPLIPGAAIGPNIAQVRMVAPQTLEAKQQMIASEKELGKIKADGKKDIGGDGFGSLAENARIPRGDDPQRENVPDEQQPGEPQQVDSTGTFKTVKASDVFKKTETPQAASKAPTDWKNATYHPFRQRSLFDNHDANMSVSKLIRDTGSNMRVLDRARRVQASIEAKDPSWTRYNPATQGVMAPYVAVSHNNFLSRGEWITAYPMNGARDLVNQFGPSAWAWDKASGGFH